MNLGRSRLTCVVLLHLVSLLTAAAGVYTVLAWKGRFWEPAGRVHYMLATFAAVAFVWFLNYWNLLGWRF